MGVYRKLQDAHYKDLGSAKATLMISCTIPHYQLSYTFQHRAVPVWFVEPEHSQRGDGIM
jgi:hypothetical protein